MEALKGKDIFVGKEAGGSHLIVAVECNGKMLTHALEGTEAVPACVSRYSPDSKTAHCRISIDTAGIMTITNMKPANVTYVDGVAVVTKRITNASRVTLGKDSYPLDTPFVLAAAAKLLTAAGKPKAASVPQKPTYSIAHLEYVYEEYEKGLELIQKRQIKMSKLQRLPIILGIASTLLSAALSKVLMWPQQYVTIPIGALSLIIWIYFIVRKDNSLEQRKAVTDRFIDNYICPNPECGHFLGYAAFKILRQNKKCSYCGCKFETQRKL